jgi:hypothetical protein
MHEKWGSRALLLGLVCFAWGCSSKPAEEKALGGSAAPLAVGWEGTGAMAEARKLHAGVVLPSGKVLVTGGSRGATYLASATVYEPATGLWTVVAPMPEARQAHTATVLKTGKVLVAGGEGSGFLSSTAVYDPASNTWASAGSFATGTGRGYMTATELSDGRVLVAGGLNNGAQSKVDVYDPATGTWAVGPALKTARRSHTATVLKNGKVLVVGGWSGGATGAAELYDPVSHTWSATGALATGRYDHTATLLASGKVLVVGGRNGAGVVGSAELYDPATGAWSATGAPGTAREFHTATLLSTGKVLVAGGKNGSALVSAEMYEEASGQWSAVAGMASARYQHVAVPLEALGKVLVVGGVGTSSLAAAELYVYDACAGVSCNSAPGPCYEAAGTCAIGVCSYAPKASGATCDDGNACTGADECNGAGVCAGTATSCNSPPGQCYVDTGTCSGGTCSYEYKAAGEQCNDQDACTVGETCNGAGGCAGTPVSCNSPPNTACYEAAGTCSGGACSYTAKAQGTVCNDNNGGTINDVCDGAGVCAGVPACTTPPSACHGLPGTYANGVCTYPFKGAGTTCDDANACTTGDVCNGAGTCGGSAISCNSPPGACYQSAGTCSNGACSYALKSAGTSCDDGDSCTSGDVCNGAGACGGSAISCNSPPGACYQSAGTCSNGTCSYALKSAGTSCDDGNSCTSGDVCNGAGTCGGSAISCNSPPGACYQAAGTCSNGTCSYAPKSAGTSCDDGDSCTSGDVCNGAGSCGGSAISCNSPPGACYQSAGTCSNGTCSYAPKSAGTSCNDGDSCTSGDVCNGAGSCGGSAISCNSPPGACYQSAGTCSNGSCSYAPKSAGTSCNDGYSCTSGDVCNGAGSCGGSAISCNSPPGACYQSAGTCSNGTCSYAPKSAGTSCNDGNSCTSGDVCNGAGSCGGSAISCNSPPGACYQSAGTCSNGTCSYAPKSAGTSCNDGNSCTSGDVCNGAGSCGGSAISCNSPPGACYQSAGTCSNGTCSYSPKSAGTGCNDGNSCTTGDICNGAGSCGGSAISCNSPPGACYQSAGTCSNGSCSYAPAPYGTGCDDGNGCTTGDICNGSGACTGGSAVSCNSPPGECYQPTGTCSNGSCSYQPKPSGDYCEYPPPPCSLLRCNGTGGCRSYTCICLSSESDPVSLLPPCDEGF